MSAPWSHTAMEANPPIQEVGSPWGFRYLYRDNCRNASLGVKNNYWQKRDDINYIIGVVYLHNKGFLFLSSSFAFLLEFSQSIFRNMWKMSGVFSFQCVNLRVLVTQLGEME